MGQRLVTAIIKNGEEICTTYHHWSGYTCSGLEIARDFINVLDDDTITDPAFELLKYLESQGGGVKGGADSKEMEYMEDKYPFYHFKQNPNRNEGLFACSPKEMEDLHNWSEGDVIIDLTNRTVQCWLWWCEDEREDSNIEPVHMGINPEEFSFDDIDAVLESAERAYDNRGFEVEYNGTIYSMIA